MSTPAEQTKIDTPEADQSPAADAAPKSGRPTTRAGRRARAEAAKAKAAAAAAAKPPSSSAPKPKQRPLAERIESFYVTLALGVGLTLGQADAQAISDNAAACAAAWDKAARANPRVAEAWERLLGVSVMGELVMAHTPVVLMIAANHGLVPPGIAAVLGSPTPPAAPEQAAQQQPQQQPQPTPPPAATPAWVA